MRRKIKYCLLKLLIGRRGKVFRYHWAIVTGISFIILAFIWLEHFDSFYFTQDDNLAQFFPVILDACRGLFHDHLFPTLNPYQFAGSPTTGLGTYSLTYPLTYLSYSIASFVLRHEFWTLEVLAFFHLLLGYLSSMLLFRFLRIRPMLATLASLSFVLCGFNLIAGRSWYLVMPVPVYLPLLILSLEQFKAGQINRCWAVTTGLTMGVAFHTGHAQMWLYSMLFYGGGILLLLNHRNMPIKKSFPLILSACLIGLAIVWPLLSWTLELVAKIPRLPLGEGILGGLWALFFPYPLVRADHPMGWGNVNKEFMGHLYYNGSFFPLTFAVVLILVAITLFLGFSSKKMTRIFQNNFWLGMALVAFLLSLGSEGFLWTALSNIGIFHKLNGPYKFLPFLHFFMILTAVIFLNRVLTSFPIKKSLQVIVWVTMMGILFYHVTCCRTAFYTYGDDPYPLLPEGMKKNLSADYQKYPARIDSRAFNRCPLKGYSQSLNHNFATVYHVPSLTGYDVLVDPPTRTPFHLFQYGVPMIVESKLGFPVDEIPYSEEASGAKSFEYSTIKFLPGALPLAFPLKDSRLALPIRFDVQGGVVDTSSLSNPQDVVVNMIYRKGYHAFASKRELDVRPDHFQRIIIKDCPVAKKIEVRYWKSLTKEFMASFFCLLLAAMFICRFRTQCPYNSF